MARQQPGQPLSASGVQRRLLQLRPHRARLVSPCSPRGSMNAASMHWTARPSSARSTPWPTACWREKRCLAATTAPSSTPMPWPACSAASRPRCRASGPSRDQPLARQAGPVGGLPLAHPGEPGLYAGRHAHQGLRWRGCPTRDLLLIGEGELKTLLHNSATAHHFGLASNGSAARNARSALDVSPRHLVFGLGPTARPRRKVASTWSWSSWTACTPAPMR